MQIIITRVAVVWYRPIGYCLIGQYSVLSVFSHGGEYNDHIVWKYRMGCQVLARVSSILLIIRILINFRISEPLIIMYVNEFEFVLSC